MKQTRVGFLGTGGIAVDHARALRRLPEVKIVALCDQMLGKAQKFNAQNLDGTARCYSDFCAMLAETPLDALYVCIPPGAHQGQVEQAAAKGIHLFLEKPIALNLTRAESIASAVRRAGVKCQMGFHLRHVEPALRLKAMLQDGSAGRPLLMQTYWFSNVLHRGWWCDPAMGGGQLIEQAIHIYDWCRYFLGDAETVAGFVGKLAHDQFPEYKVDDTSASTIRFRNGAMASVCASNAADPWFGAVTATVICEKVMVQFKSPEEAMFVYHNGMPAEKAWEPGVSRKCEEVRNLANPRDVIDHNFIAAIHGEQELRSSVEDGLESLRLVLGVVESSRQAGGPQRQ